MVDHLEQRLGCLRGVELARGAAEGAAEPGLEVARVGVREQRVERGVVLHGAQAVENQVLSRLAHLLEQRLLALQQRLATLRAVLQVPVFVALVAEPGESVVREDPVHVLAERGVGDDLDPEIPH